MKNGKKNTTVDSLFYRVLNSALLMFFIKSQEYDFASARFN